MTLAERRCVPCEGGVPKLPESQAKTLLAELSGWEVRDDKLVRTFKFKDFAAAMAFLNRVAEVAEAENHHPDFCVHYRIVDMSIWTHAIGGLSENDFILAAKVNRLVD
ncbi:MAG: 4a-hydroxytetrahydrobiopterin dehydratase [Candidatus Sericytochromatia bacterium]|uniref:Putative pterin-4-alpha-carbinolamine dehydratase n=1 Tax=Candidatus Tanganyikabacteria bacterium TaxID=2961651 RepID=A0A938BMD9_9BACT|nr:4a-hydroxytetrahydrobiopterin dehydratase [Candidatus Tanganyikabacteria bacterium]